MRRLCIVIDRPWTLGTDWRGQRSKSPPADSHRGVGLDSTREKLDRRTSSGLDPMTQWAPLSGRRENSSCFLQDVVENSWADHKWTGDVMEWKKRDLLADRGQRVRIDKDGKKYVIGSVGDPAKLLRHVRNDDWNDYQVIVRGNAVTLRINGVTMSELVDEDPRRPPTGHLALQTHVGPPMTVQFRKIRIKQD